MKRPHVHALSRALIAVLTLSSSSSEVWALPSEAPFIAGPARVLDGDTLDIEGQRIRLEGIDAPELTQTCVDAQARAWPCGRRAQQALSALTDGETVACDKVGDDKYGRTLAVCYVADTELNARMVVSGNAWAFVKYSQAYAANEAAARASRTGIWQGENTPAWEFRRGRWQTAETAAPGGCAIKGNISNRGHIYHVPWSGWYDKVAIDPSRGERWFCSEAEAQAAGFRAALQR